MGGYGLDQSLSTQRQVPGSCKHGNELLGPKKCKELPDQPLLHRMSQFKNQTKMFSLTSSNSALSLAWKSNTSLYISHSLWLLQKENNLNIKLNYLHDKMWIHKALYSMVKRFHTPHSTPQNLQQIHYNNQHFCFYCITKRWSRCTNNDKYPL